MDRKTLHTLEYPKILEKLAKYCAFSGSADLARKLHPSNEMDYVRIMQAQTSEARRLLDLKSGMSIGGVRDIREEVEGASRGVILDPVTLLSIKHTLVAIRDLIRSFERMESSFPLLTEIALRVQLPPGLIDSITRIITERAEIHDNASPRLAEIRREMRIIHDRLLTKMQKMLTDPKIAPYLQDNLITQRDGRYVIPLRADFKGKVKAVIHDQSASGATLFVEPLGVVEHNNQYRQLQLDERDEERRILAVLSRQIGEFRWELEALLEAAAELDLAFARAKYAEDLNAVEPILHRIPPLPKTAGDPSPSIAHPGTIIRLQGARHPLLDPRTVVPIDVLLDQNTYALIITGPNTGGKTVTLKTIGLHALMAQSGLHIPADPGSEISLFEDIYADIGDEQSIEQSLSTFSAHITNIIRILELASPRSLILLDELGSGTDPGEGAALAMAILTFLLDQSITTMVATHYPELKSYALARAGAINASVEFDVETLRPTYHLVIGLPGASNALTIASRLGLREDIIQVARQGVSPEELKAEDLLVEIHQQRDLIRKARRSADLAREEAEQVRDQLANRLEAIEDERRAILEKARGQANQRIEELEGEMRDLRRRLALARQPLEVVESVADEVEQLQEKAAEPVERQEIDQQLGFVPASGGKRRRASAPHREIRLGDKVRLRSLGTQGVVSALSEDEAEVQIGLIRVRTRRSELELASSESTDASQPGEEAGTKKKGGSRQGKSTANLVHESPGVELDIRGKRVEDSLEELSDYLDRAYLAQLPWVRIIHGKGTGRLRDAVRTALQTNPHVKSFGSGQQGEGDDGVTVAKFDSKG